MKDHVLSHLGVGSKAAVLAIACALAAAPSLAQSGNSVATPPASDIGPGELSNFSLNGTVTRPAEQPAAPQPTPAPRPAPSTISALDRPAQPTATQRPATSAPAQPGSDLLRRPPTLPDASAANAVTTASPILPVGNSEPSPALQSEGTSLLPWIVALFAVAGMAIMFFGRKGRPRPVGHPPIDLGRRAMSDPAPQPDPVPRPAPVPAPVPATASAAGGARRPLPTTLMPPPLAAAPRADPAPTAQPRPDPIVPGGIVSTGLRPWIDIELTPDRALLDAQGTAIAFELTLFNSGSAAARDVVIEARLLNAGARQDIELSEFFAVLSTGDPIPQIAPYARIPLRSAVRLTRDDIREYDIEGRKLFVPLVAVNVRYRWSSGDGQSAAGFLIGQSGEGKEKLAPLRLDKGDRSWTGLGVRRYEKGIRS